MSGFIGFSQKRNGVVNQFTSQGIDDNANATAITIDSSERVGVGHTGPLALLDVGGIASGGSESSQFICAKSVNGEAHVASFINSLAASGGSTDETIKVDFRFMSSGSGTNLGTAIVVGKEADHTDAASVDNYMAFHTSLNNSLTERMRINGTGNVGIGTTSIGHRLHVYQDADDNQIFKLDNPHSSRPRIMVLAMSGASPDDTTQTFVEGNDSSGAEFRIRSDGSFYQNSDRRTKENIVDADAMLDKVNNFRVVNYNRIGDKNKNLHLGVISQEVEKIFPHLVFTEDAVEAVEEVRDEDDNLITSAIQSQEERKTLYKIGLIFPLIKAVQELSAKVTALEAA